MKVLVVVDMQNDFITGSLGTAEAQAIVSAVADRVASSKDELILFTKDTHCDDYLDTPEGKKLPVVHCVKGTKGWEIEDSIMAAYKAIQKNWKVEDSILATYKTIGKTIFEKSVFGSTDLVDGLKMIEDQITEIEIFGLCTDICVASNAIMLKNSLPNTKIVVNQKLSAGVTPKSHEEALNTMRMCQIDVV